MNESIGLVMGYCYLLLINIVTDADLRKWLGLAIVIAAGVLIFLNFSLLGKAIIHKTKLKCAKYKFEKRQKK